MKLKLLRNGGAMALAMVAMAAHAQRGDDLKLNQIQIVGTHNSYSQGVDPQIMAMADAIIGPRMSQMAARMPPAARAQYKEYHPNEVSMTEALNYRYGTLSEQLDAGMRSLELDLNRDPDGARFLRPAAYEAAKAKGIAEGQLLPHDKTGLDQPGLKVMHIVDFDVRSSCNLFTACLAELRRWSDAHPNHEPIFILLEAKSDPVPIFPGSKPPLPFTAQAFDEMDADLFKVIGRERIVTPDKVRGAYPTLEAGVKAGNWPSLKDARGKFVFLLLTALDTNGLSGYVGGHPNLEGRAAFLESKPGQSYGAFLLMDNATMRAKEIPELVRQGYLVRARADIETWEAKANDMGRARQAFASGAQIVSTDFYKPGNAYGTDYIVKLPGGGAMRCNPVNAGKACR
ncbi:Ca2+-dependent phosphoinositide-specific phospholipase C [Novosphingobium sediminicola]|uniref:Calcium-dependent phosphoinositide phospholipase C n=1 Tax=Novosphingobium sediminicola TaxID=563162 RepID=A0A7W6CKR7_9SPHN|nr:Ca2+-dependent phosphoinositide-specific phospholipase C [Novosphingobium sediminicola]MBB3957285.1 hypothetical protein [Novosphingobium sediminicola]